MQAPSSECVIHLSLRSANNLQAPDFHRLLGLLVIADLQAVIDRLNEHGITASLAYTEVPIPGIETGGSFLTAKVTLADPIAREPALKEIRYFLRFMATRHGLFYRVR